MRWTGYLWVPEVVLLLVPVGMVSVLDGTHQRQLQRPARLVLGGVRRHHHRAVVVTRLALKERYYSAVMAATGLLYLAILTAFGTDLVARALLS